MHAREAAMKLFSSSVFSDLNVYIIRLYCMMNEPASIKATGKLILSDIGIRYLYLRYKTDIYEKKNYVRGSRNCPIKSALS